MGTLYEDDSVDVLACLHAREPPAGNNRVLLWTAETEETEKERIRIHQQHRQDQLEKFLHGELDLQSALDVLFPKYWPIHSKLQLVELDAKNAHEDTTRPKGRTNPSNEKVSTTSSSTLKPTATLVTSKTQLKSSKTAQAPIISTSTANFAPYIALYIDTVQLLATINSYLESLIDNDSTWEEPIHSELQGYSTKSNSSMSNVLDDTPGKEDLQDLLDRSMSIEITRNSADHDRLLSERHDQHQSQSQKISKKKSRDKSQSHSHSQKHKAKSSLSSSSSKVEASEEKSSLLSFSSSSPNSENHRVAPPKKSDKEVAERKTAVHTCSQLLVEHILTKCISSVTDVIALSQVLTLRILDKDIRNPEIAPVFGWIRITLHGGKRLPEFKLRNSAAVDRLIKAMSGYSSISPFKQDKNLFLVEQSKVSRRVAASFLQFDKIPSFYGANPNALADKKQVHVEKTNHPGPMGGQHGHHHNHHRSQSSGLDLNLVGSQQNDESSASLGIDARGKYLSSSPSKSAQEGERVETELPKRLQKLVSSSPNQFKKPLLVNSQPGSYASLASMNNTGVAEDNVGMSSPAKTVEDIDTEEAMNDYLRQEMRKSIDRDWRIGLLQRFSKITHAVRSVQKELGDVFFDDRGGSQSRGANRSGSRKSPSMSREASNPSFSASYSKANNTKMFDSLDLDATRDPDSMFRADSNFVGPIRIDSSGTPKSEPVTRQTWESSFDEFGKLVDPLSVKQAIFIGGLAPDARHLVWPFLLHVFDWDSTKEERENHVSAITKEYRLLCRAWKWALLECKKTGMNMESILGGVDLEEFEREEGTEVDAFPGDGPWSLMDTSSRKGTENIDDLLGLNEDADGLDATQSWNISKTIEKTFGEKGPVAALFDAFNTLTTSPSIPNVDDLTMAEEVDPLALSEAVSGGQSSSSPSQFPAQQSLRIEEDNDQSLEQSERAANDEQALTLLPSVSQKRTDFIEYVCSFRSQVLKDVVRTDRGVPEFEPGDESTNSLLYIMQRVLSSYAIKDRDIGYCQGMSDFLSPMVHAFFVRRGNDWMSPQELVELEAILFSSFENLMLRVGSNFSSDQVGIRSQLARIRRIVLAVDRDLLDFFDKSDPSFYSVYRWVLVQFKREVEFGSIPRLWEVFWMDHIAPNELHLYVAVALLLYERERILQLQAGQFDQILRFVNSMAKQFDPEAAIELGTKLYLRIGRMDAGASVPEAVVADSFATLGITFGL